MSGKPLYIRNAAQLVTLKGPTGPRTRGEMEQLSIIQGGSVWVEAGRIRFVGTDEEVRRRLRSRIEEADEIDATGRLVTPGLVDPHTHLVFAGSREGEFEMRLKGATYMEIMKAGGGIHATTTATRQASREQIYEESQCRLDQFLRHGVTTLEAKSGYGLSLEQELKQLEVARDLNQDHPVEVVSTFMGAHAVPAAYRDRSDDFVDQVIREMIPEVARRKLAEFNDVFCERGVFTPDQSRRILEAGKEHGLAPKIHADEIEPYGGAELAAEVGAVSADHLLKASAEGIQAMAKKGVVAVLLPGTAFFLMAEMANGRNMVDAGVPVALSTDCNPGSSPTVSLPLIMNLACLHMGMTPAEVLTAATINAAYAINRGDELGSIEEGKQADLVLFDVPNYMGLQYHYGSNHAAVVVKGGRVVYRRD
ncbi:imidazolonepropionase [Melghirimyces thermohalophilus]|uniref:Imidazolonepropionase n=1 Tax=Melghirimyces thermohalophilus TaxID=1236220 RepID=A0A1G6K887_9BACL|nr:imidazolonepropionase [Melghirimyces thermohalophilus]SDC27163.1 imidazolonepropionase [Melghirimyces thermohalophilus]